MASAGVLFILVALAGCRLVVVVVPSSSTTMVAPCCMPRPLCCSFGNACSSLYVAVSFHATPYIFMTPLAGARPLPRVVLQLFFHSIQYIFMTPLLPLPPPRSSPSWLSWFAVALPVSLAGNLICWLLLLIVYQPHRRWALPFGFTCSTSAPRLCIIACCISTCLPAAATHRLPAAQEVGRHTRMQCYVLQIECCCTSLTTVHLWHQFDAFAVASLPPRRNVTVATAPNGDANGRNPEPAASRRSAP